MSEAETNDDPQSAKAAPKRVWRRRILTLLALVVALVLMRPLAVEFALWRGAVNIEAREHDGALGWLNFAAKLDGDNAELHYLLGRCHRRLENFRLAREHYQQAKDLGYDIEQLKRENLLALAQTGQYDKLEGEWSRLFDTAGSDGPEISEAFVRACLQQLKIADALRVIDAWKKDYPDDPESWYMHGQVHENLARFGEAVECYSEAILRKSDHDAAKRHKAFCLVKLAKLEEAVGLLNEIPEESPEFDEAQLLMIQCLIKMNQLTRARKRLLNALQKSPDNADLLVEQGLLELKLGNTAKALPILKTAARKRPSNAALRYGLGRALKDTGDARSAQKEFDFVNKATKELVRMAKLTAKLQSRSQDADLRHEIGRIAWTYRSRKEGALWFRTTLQVAPKHIPSHRSLIRHYEWKGDTKKAAAHRAAVKKLAGEP